MKSLAGTLSEVRAASDEKVNRRLVEWLNSAPKWNVSSNYEAVGWTGKGPRCGLRGALHMRPNLLTCRH